MMRIKLGNSSSKESPWCTAEILHFDGVRLRLLLNSSMGDVLADIHRDDLESSGVDLSGVPIREDLV